MSYSWSHSRLNVRSRGQHREDGRGAGEGARCLEMDPESWGAGEGLAGHEGLELHPCYLNFLNENVM